MNDRRWRQIALKEARHIALKITLKAHIGVDAKQGTVHTVVTTAANVSDSRVLP